MFLFRIGAAVLFLLAVLSAAGVGFDQSVTGALALVASGLLCWVVSTFPVPPPPPSR